MPQPPLLCPCHASGHPAITTGPHALPLWASLIKLREPHSTERALAHVSEQLGGEIERFQPTCLKTLLKTFTGYREIF